jgi:hypothetical protein
MGLNIRRLVSVHPDRAAILQRRIRKEFQLQTIFWKEMASEVITDDALSVHPGTG